MIAAVIDGHDEVLAAVRAAEPRIAELVEAAADRTRVIYVGAGTGGRLAAMDACEWGPTYGVSDEAVVTLLAGDGLKPGSYEDEASEDDAEGGAAAMRALAPTAGDVVVGVSASGSTPFVVGALEAARPAVTAAVTCRPGSPLAGLVDIPIELPVGDEVVSGSTRLKAGTAQKIVLGAFSTALMVRRGRTVGSLMAGMRVSNTKLRGRAMSVCMGATGCDEEAARAALERAGWQLDAAVVMLAAGVEADVARERLLASGGAIEAAMR
ncbi:MAG TPA: N-acetylmuramic acid 6-phosphate etherase [Solirubrobacteraceae bacterium]|nr:N-acetylmuramic acid 6-phosphate etherase [Solirubrobacteraceae bacterium]